MSDRDTSSPESEPITPIEADPPVKAPLAIEDWLSVLLLGALAVITFLNVLVRYFTDQSFAWTEEISVFLMIVVTLVAGGSAFVRNHHIRIEAFADSGSPRRRRILAIVSQAVVLAFFVALAVLSGRLVWDEFIYEETSPAIGVPTWWYSVWLPVLSAGIALRVLGGLRRLLRRPA